MNERSTSPGVGLADIAPRAHSTLAALRMVFGITAFLSSALIFTVEPMFAKMLLPLLGGAPAVWNTCVVFFQAALLCAYAYAHLLSTRLPRRQQAVTHGVLVLLACAAMPVAVPSGWLPPADRPPVIWLLIALTVGVGAPFIVVSATAPLLQKWFAGTDDPSAKDPYFLYSASNVGSMAALLAYPFLVEPSWSLSQQSSIWTVGYMAFAGLMLACAVISTRAASPANDIEVAARIETEAAVPSPSWLQRGTWLVQSLVPSSLLLGVTAYISTDVAAVPLLWVLPLALYLLSFAWAFAPKPVLPVSLVSRAMPMLVSVLVLVMAARIGTPAWIIIPLHLFAFFACALRLHIAVADSRPHSRHLTDFYLCLAIGGVLGGALNTFVFPVLFTGIMEYPAAIVAACLLQALGSGSDRRVKTLDILLPVCVGGAMTAVMLGASVYQLRWTTVIALVGPLAVWCFSFSRRPLRFGLAVGTILAVAHLYTPQADALVFASRTFFGVLRVRAHASEHVLWHGSTIHGQQDLAAARRDEPLTYYHRSGPMGQVMNSMSSRLDRARIGVVGLGAGSLAAYARPGQRWTFYEIDPEMRRVASDPALFTYLDGCAEACEVVLGDARLSLARPGTPAFRLLVLDAFSSDAIPIHLVTREALDLYLRHLEPDGVIAFHISNRHLNLAPVFATLAADRGLVALSSNDHDPDEQVHPGRFPSEWLVMARDAKAFGELTRNPLWYRPVTRAGMRIWTDDYSDILAVLGKKK